MEELEELEEGAVETEVRAAARLTQNKQEWTDGHFLTLELTFLPGGTGGPCQPRTAFSTESLSEEARV